MKYTCLVSDDVLEWIVVRVLHKERRDPGQMDSFTGWLVCGSAVRFGGCLWSLSVGLARVARHVCVWCVLLRCIICDIGHSDIVGRLIRTVSMWDQTTWF